MIKLNFFTITIFLIFSNGVELAKALSSEGAHVYGWDMEWNMDYNINRYTSMIWSGIWTIILIGMLFCLLGASQWIIKK